MNRRRIAVLLTLTALVAISVPRYVDGFTSGDYAQAAQMVALVWVGFFASARYWVKDDPRFVRVLLAIAAVLCMPPLLYHLYDGRRFSQRAGNLFLLSGIIIYTYGALIRREPVSVKQPGK